MALTDEDILLEYEADLAFNGEVLKTCPQCETQTHRPKCPECRIKLTGDGEMDRVFAEIEAGEDVDLDARLRPQKQTDTFEPVKPEDIP